MSAGTANAPECYAKVCCFYRGARNAHFKGSHMKAIYAFVIAVMLSGCSTMGPGLSSGSVTAGPDVLRVGVTPNAAPMVFKQNGRIVGFEADMAARLGEYLGRRVEFVEVKWVDQIPALQDGRTDIIMSGMTRTQLRNMRINFSEPYLRTGQLALVHADALSSIRSAYSIILTDGEVGVVEGTTGDYFVQQYFRKASRKTYSDVDKAVQDLQKKKIDMFIYDAPTIWWLAAEHESKGLRVGHQPLTDETLAWGLRKTDGELLEQVNTFLHKMHTAGELNKILRNWNAAQ